MNASQIHLALNHVPLFFSIIGGLVLIYGFIRKNESIKILSLYFMIAAAVFTLPVYLTGQGTEEMIEKLPGISEGMIEEHEEMAKIGLIIIIITGVAALSALILKKKTSLLKPVLILCAVFSFASFGVFAQTAHLGGQIRHTEIQNNSVASTKSENPNNESDEKKEKAKEQDDD